MVSLERKRRTDVVAGYEEVASTLLREGYVPFYGSVMFNHIGGSKDRQKDIMTYEVNRIYDLVTNHIIKDPRSENGKLWCPTLMGCHDEKVWKRGQRMGRKILPNAGMHFNFMMFLVGPRTAPTTGRVKPLGINRNLVEHFDQKQHLYARSPVSRVFVTQILTNDMADYTFKTFRRGLAGDEDVLLRTSRDH